MKTVTVTKDAYIDNSVRVNYFDPMATRKENRMKPLVALAFSLSGSPSLSGVNIPQQDLFEEVDITYENLLFCERLKWDKEESELDEQIENKRLEFERQINI